MKKIKYITWLLVTIFLVSNAAFAAPSAAKRDNIPPKYDYNLQQRPAEKTTKNPYEIGDVIRYDHTKSSLNDIYIIINRP